MFQAPYELCSVSIALTPYNSPVRQGEVIIPILQTTKLRQVS